MKCFDCIVIGFGGIGSAALWSAAKRGWSVLGIDQFGSAHDRGSSHGHTRIIRRAYFEHPNYVPLVERSYALWDELTKRHRTAPEVKELLITTGLLQVGHPDSEVIRGVQASAERFNLEIETLTPAQIEHRLPIFKIPPRQIGLFEPGAGILKVELCVAAMIGQATRHGAEVLSDTSVDRWFVQDDETVVVQTDRGSFAAKRLVIAGGAWSPALLPDLDLRLRVLKKQLQWFQLDRVDQKLINRFPAFLFEQEDGEVFYGIPEIDYLGMKVCQHSGGELVDNPSELNRALDAAELARVEAFMDRHLNFTHHRMVHHSTCMYTMSPDSHFVVDCYPERQQVSFAAGMSGHGFKFAPEIGRYLVDLVDGKRQADFDFLRIRSS